MHQHEKSLPPSTLSKLSLSKQLDIYSPGPVNLQCYAQAA